MPEDRLSENRNKTPRGFRIFFFDRMTSETVACPQDYSIKLVGRRQFLFFKDDVAYDVDLENSTCTCPDFMTRRMGTSPCKHLRLAKAIEPR